jgi:outer membrane protein insertion porin family
VNRINFGLTYANVELFNRSSYEQTDRFYSQFEDINDPDAPIKYDSLQASVSWLRNTLNRGVFPSDGSSQRASFSVTTPNSDVKYFKTILDTKFYFPLTRNQRWTVLARARLGYGNGYSDVDGVQQILPFTENFTAGGSDTLRGFENNTVGPRGIQRSSNAFITTPEGNRIPTDPANDILFISRRSLGGNAMALAGLELIVPTPFVDTEFDRSVRTSLFFDVGNVWDTEFDYSQYEELSIGANSDPIADYSDWKEYRSSAGLSVQWISPMGPLVFSFSRALKERPGDDAKFFTFNIGQTF